MPMNEYASPLGGAISRKDQSPPFCHSLNGSSDTLSACQEERNLAGIEPQRSVTTLPTRHCASRTSACQ
eukprot:7390194-Prymnesium_polylepis.1